MDSIFRDQSLIGQLIYIFKSNYNANMTTQLNPI